MSPKGDAPVQLSASEEYELWTLLTQVSDGMLRARDNELRRFGTSGVQVAIMYALKNLGPSPTQSEIANWVFRRPNTVAAALDRMERQGLIRQLRNAEGKKQVRVEMTEKGKEMYRQQRGQRQAIPTILGSLTPAERDLLRALLRKLRTQTLAELSVKPAFP